MSGSQKNGVGGDLGGMCEVRAIEGEIRAAGGEISGYGAVFNQAAEILPGFREVIRPGAFTRAIEEGADVRALWNHDSNFVLGRRSSGTLAIQEDEHGLKYVVQPPEAQWARDLQVSIGRRDVSGSSFAFVVVTERWTQDAGAGWVLRELLDLDLIDVSPVTYPAYAGTSVGLRAAGDARRALARYLASQVRGLSQEALQELVDEVLSGARAVGDQAVAGAGPAAQASAQERLAVRRRRLRLME